MADPTKLDFSDWFQIIVGSMLSGIGAAMGWFRYSKRDIYKKIGVVEQSMKSWQELHAEHNTSLAVLKTCQEHTKERLEEIGTTTRDTNESLKELSQTVTQVLLAIQAQKK